MRGDDQAFRIFMKGRVFMSGPSEWQKGWLGDKNAGLTV